MTQFTVIAFLFVLSATAILHSASTSLCSSRFPKATSTTTVTKTITVSGTADYKNARLVGSGLGSCSLSTGGQVPIIIVANGGTLKNVIIGANNGQGVWCAGSCTLENVFWEQVCYHAAAFACSSSSSGCTSSKSFTYTVKGGAAYASQDKLFTQSGMGTTTIDGFCGEGLGTASGGNGGNGKVWCSCGMCNPFVKRTLKLQNSVFTGKGLSLGSTNTFMGDSVSFSNVSLYYQSQSAYKIAFACEEYATEANARAAIPYKRYSLSESGTGKSCNYGSLSGKVKIVS